METRDKPLQESSTQETTETPNPRTKLPEIAGIVYLLLAAWWLMVGLLQILLPLLGVSSAGIAGIDIRVVGAWNAVISIIYLAIGIGLCRRSSSAWNWGLTSALLSIPVVLLTGALSCSAIPSLSGYVVVSFLLWKSRKEFARARVGSPSSIAQPTAKPEENADVGLPAAHYPKPLIVVAALVLIGFGGLCLSASFVVGTRTSALQGLASTVAAASDPAESHLNQGNAHVRNGELDLAIADCDWAIKLKPDYVDAYICRADIYYQTGDWDRALSDMDQILRLRPDDADAYVSRGNIYDEKGNLDQALADYGRAIELKPDLARAHYNRGIAYSRKGELDLALADLDQAIKLNPDYPMAILNRGMANYNKGNLDRALDDLNRAIEFKSDLACLYCGYFHRGKVYSAKKDFDRALADYDQAVSLRPADVDAYLARGATYVEKGDVDQAIADFDRSIKLEPANARAYMLRAGAYAQKEDWERAIADAKKVLEFSQDPEGRQLAERFIAGLATIPVRASASAVPPRAPAEWPILINANFDTNADKWPTGESNDEYGPANRFIKEGKYRWEVKADKSLYWRGNPTCKSVSNYYVTVQAQRVSGLTSARYGLVFNYDGANYGRFMIRDDQFFMADVYYQEGRETLIDWTRTSAIRPGEVNQLTVRGNGPRFTFFINDQFVGETTNDHLTAGRPGLIIVLGAGESAVYEFDNFELRVLSDAS